MKKLMLTGIFLLLGLILIEGGSAFAATVTVTQVGTSFGPSLVTISVGDVIRWEWTSGIHTTTSGTGTGDPQAGLLWDESLTAGATFYEHTFNSAGTFPYFCRPHFAIGMIGEITVIDPPACDCGDPFGDVNDDGGVNPVDVVFMVNKAYKNLDALVEPAGWNCPNPIGDVNSDGGVNPVDVVYFVNKAYKNLDAFINPCGP